MKALRLPSSKTFEKEAKCAVLYVCKICKYLLVCMCVRFVSIYWSVIIYIPLISSYDNLLGSELHQ